MTQRGDACRSHAVSGLAVFMLLALFALAGLLTVLLGVHAFQGVQGDVAASASARVLTGYLRAKVRASDRAGDVLIRREATGTVLCLREGELESRIFVRDGALMEQLCLTADPFDPELGEPLTSAQGLQATLDGSLLTLVVAREAAQPLTLTMALRGGGEVRP